MALPMSREGGLSGRAEGRTYASIQDGFAQNCGIIPNLTCAGDNTTSMPPGYFCAHASRPARPHRREKKRKEEETSNQLLPMNSILASFCRLATWFADNYLLTLQHHRAYYGCFPHTCTTAASAACFCLAWTGLPATTHSILNSMTTVVSVL